MGIFGPTTIDEHLKRVNDRMDHPTTALQKTGEIGVGVINTGVAAAVGSGIALGAEAIAKDPDKFKILDSQAIELQRNGSKFTGLFQIVDHDKVKALGALVKENLKPKTFFTNSVAYAKEHPKDALLIGSASVALGGITALGQRMQNRLYNRAELGKSVEELHKLGDKGTDQDRQRIVEGMMGSRWTSREDVREAASQSKQPSL